LADANYGLTYNSINKPTGTDDKIYLSNTIYYIVYIVIYVFIVTEYIGRLLL